MIINHAILHIADIEHNNLVCSYKELDLKKEYIYDFIIKKVSRILDGDTQHGEMPAEHEVMKILDTEETDFIAKSQYMSKLLFAEMEKMENIPNGDLLFVQVTEDIWPYYALIKIDYKESLTHTTDYEEDMLVNKIISHHSVYNSIGLRPDESLIINMKDKSFKLIEKKHELNGEEIPFLSQEFLKVDLNASVKENVSTLKKVMRTVGKKYEVNQDVALIETQNAIYESLESEGTISNEKIAEVVFKDNIEAKAEYIETLKEQNVAPVMKLPDPVAMEKKFKKQKLKLDNGIELTVPVELYNDRDVIEFVNNVNGTTSVILKNIDKITNRF